MTSDLPTLLDRTLTDVRVLADAWPHVAAERHPPGIDYTTVRVSGGREHDDRVGPLKLKAGWPAPNQLEYRWRQAMAVLARAFAAVSEAQAVQRMLWNGEGDNIAQASVWPDVDDTADNQARLRLAWLVTHRLIDAHTREGLSFADTVHARGWCEEVHDAANSLPEWVRHPGVGSVRLCQGRAAIGADESGRRLLTSTACPEHTIIRSIRQACLACSKATAHTLERYRPTA